MKKHICNVCGWEYDPVAGDPDNGIAPGTAFEDLPEDFVCPVCGAGKDDFEASGEAAPAAPRLKPLRTTIPRPCTSAR